MSDTPEKAAEEIAQAGTKWFSPKNREVAFGKGIGVGKTVLRGAGTVVGVGAIVLGVKDILRGLHVMAPKQDEEGKEIPAGMGTLVFGIGKLAGGALLTMHSVMRPKGAPAVSV